jgi:hypothetical protein
MSPTLSRMGMVATPAGRRGRAGLADSAAAIRRTTVGTIGVTVRPRRIGVRIMAGATDIITMLTAA